MIKCNHLCHDREHECHLCASEDPVFSQIDQRDYWHLLEALTGKSRAQLIARPDIELTPEQRAQLAQWIYQHVHEHKPIQYIIGNVPFGSLTINIEPPVLIPRPETEEWVLDLIAQLSAAHEVPRTIVDLGTGSGCIALTLAAAFPDAHVTAVDIADHALACARANAACNKISNVNFITADMFSLIPGLCADLVVSNPPYISDQEYQDLDLAVTRWEDKGALVADQDGYAYITALSRVCARHVVVEIGHLQGQRARDIFLQAGFDSVTLKRDYAGKDRVVHARRSSHSCSALMQSNG